ncbi:MAG: DNA-3-methyladenine glycosylase 2 family protein [Flavobacteriaceae bacterium]
MKDREPIVNPKNVDYLVNNFTVFKDIYNQHGAPPNWNRKEGFETLVLIILEQQVSLPSAKAHFLKLRDYVGNITPENLLKLTDEEFRENHISRQKTSYIKGLADAVLQNELQLDKLSNLTEDEVREQLTKLKGIGNWTANVYLLSCLQFKDIFPIGDLALVNAIRELTSLQTKEEILEFSKNWKPYRSLATYFFWHHYLSKKGKTLETIDILK